MSITLELPSDNNLEGVVEDKVAREISETMQRLEKLTPEEQKQVADFSRQIDLHSTETILRYGENAQNKLESFADDALKSVTGRDVEEIGALLAKMSVSIKEFDDETDNKFLNLFRSAKKQIVVLRTKYAEVSDSLDRIKKELIGQRATLLVDISNLDKMYQQNLEYYKELTMYILAGRSKLEATRNGELQELKKQAEKSGAQEDAFLYKDLKDHCESFELQLHDLELTRAVCLQTAPQIRLIQKTDEQLARKLQSSAKNTIGIWKQKTAIALAIQHNEDASEIQKTVTDMTSQMLIDNAKKMHTSMVAATKEAERGIIDYEAIKATNQELLATIDDVLAEQEAGRQRRTTAEVELRKIEEELKNKLLGVSKQIS